MSAHGSPPAGAGANATQTSDQQTAPQGADAVADDHEGVGGALTQLVGFLSQGGTLGDLRGLEHQHYEALYAIGHSHYELGQYDKAVEMFQFLVLMNPWDRRFPMALGSAYQMTGRFDKALGYYTMAVSLNMMDPIPMFHTAECMIALGMFEEAIDALGFVLRHAKTPEQEPYKLRAQGLLPLVQEQARKVAAEKGSAASQAAPAAEPSGGAKG